MTSVLGASAQSALFAAAAVGASCVFSVAAGALCAVAPARSRFAFLRVLDFALAFPTLLLALAYAAVRGPGWDTLIVSLSIGTLPGFTRLIYVRANELLSEDFVQASHALGSSPVAIARVHLLPALTSICAVKAPNLFAHALLAEATLSFLGIGAPIGQDTWGSLLAQSKDYLIEAPHLAIGVGVPLVLTVLALQFVSESLSSKHLRR